METGRSIFGTLEARVEGLMVALPACEVMACDYGVGERYGWQELGDVT
jgi:hypothetical protein